MIKLLIVHQACLVAGRRSELVAAWSSAWTRTKSTFRMRLPQCVLFDSSWFRAWSPRHVLRLLALQREKNEIYQKHGSVRALLPNPILSSAVSSADPRLVDLAEPSPETCCSESVTLEEGASQNRDSVLWSWINLADVSPSVYLARSAAGREIKTTEVAVELLDINLQQLPTLPPKKPTSLPRQASIPEIGWGELTPSSWPTENFALQRWHLHSQVPAKTPEHEP